MKNIKKYADIKNVKESHRAEIYYPIYKKTVKKAKKEVDFIIKTLQLPPNAQVLDLGCGFGRHTIELAKRGFKVCGIDISKSLLELAKNEAKTKNLKVKFHCKDICKINFRNKFDAVIMMLNTFGLLSDKDNEKVINNIANALKKNGKVFIDLRNPPKLKKGNLYKKVEQIDKLKIYTEINQYPSKKRALVHRYFFKNGKRYDYIFTARLYTLLEIKKLFAKYGMKILNIFGDFSGNKYNKNNSPRLIIVGKKI